MGHHDVGDALVVGGELGLRDPLAEQHLLRPRNLDGARAHRWPAAASLFLTSELRVQPAQRGKRLVGDLLLALAGWIGSVGKRIASP